MSERAEAGEGRRRLLPGFRDTWVLGGLVVLAPACALVWFAWPRTLAPLQPPSLTLAAAPVLAALQADHEAAARVPESKLIEALDENFLAQGRADSGLQEPLVRHRERHKGRQQLLTRVVKEHGQEAVLALRARAVERFEALLAGRSDLAEAPGILGVFPNYLATQGVTRQGLDVTPRFVVRTLYKVRWNRLHGLERAHRFSQIEAQAYFGWLALHAFKLPVPQRLWALDAYERAGGQRAAEARGVLRFRNGEYAGAVEALEQAQAHDSSLRLRNYLRGARWAATAWDEAKGRRFSERVRGPSRGPGKAPNGPRF
ncbi:MAG: hypothetical protein OXU20_07895 [Myxococcales bacterium]|nr:hypothetical protein [Myxococcales bacterium]